MPKKGGRSKSKRLTLKQKYKIKKKVSEHHKKKRKEERKAGTKPKGPKDPGLPQQWPFKEELVKEFAWKRQQILETEKAKKVERKRAREEKNEAMETEETQLAQLAAMRSNAARKGEDFEDHKRPRTDVGPVADADASRRAFYREFRKVVELADVVLCVLDARDPLGSRCPDAERYVRSLGANKRVVLLMNKMDLVPREVGEQWLRYLREELPTIAFKSSTQQQDRGLQSRSMPMARSKAAAAKAAAAGGVGGEDALKGAGCLGADTLIQLLKNYARNAGLKTAITVGVVGLPNVGKSSVINSLKRARVAQVGNTPGVTRAVQEVHLDKHIKLLDSPGIVFSTSEGEAASALRNAIKVERLPDPVLPVGEILRRVPAKQLMTLYKVSTFTNVDEFLQRIADARGKLKRGGIPDTAAAARIVLQDWNDGRIPYYTTPPERAGKEHEAAEVVAQWAAEFDADTVFANEASAVIAQLPSMEGDEGGRFFEAASAGAVDMGLDAMQADADNEEAAAGSSDAEDMDEGDAYGAAPRAKGAKAGTSGQLGQLYSEEGQYNPHAARAEKKRQKKARLSLPEDEGDSDFDFEEANEGLPAPEQAGSGSEEEGSGDEEGSDVESEEYGEGAGGKTGDVDAEYLEAMEGSDLEDDKKEGGP